MFVYNTVAMSVSVIAAVEPTTTTLLLAALDGSGDGEGTANGVVAGTLMGLSFITAEALPFKDPDPVALVVLFVAEDATANSVGSGPSPWQKSSSVLYLTKSLAGPRPDDT